MKGYKPLHMRNFNNVNEPYECVMLLDRLNLVITTLYQLSDTGYHLDYIFNSRTTVMEQLKEKGIDESYFTGVAEKLEYLRSIVYGDCIDWQGLVDYEFRLIATSEREENKILTKQIRKLEYDLRKQEKTDTTP